jgi:Protein of unknown function (DUF2865)
VSVSGQLYTALPNAYRYRKEFNAACSCRRPGQSWADALKNADDSTTLDSTDIVVTEQKSKAMSQAPPAKGGAAAAVPVSAAATTPAAAATTDPSKRTVRSVGPPFVPAH